MKTWLLAARPATLSASLVPVAVGSACAYDAAAFRLGPAVAALFGALCIQIGTNFVNDVEDAERGADTAARLGPARAVASGQISARAMKLAAAITFALAAVAGIYLTAIAGWPVVAIGVVSILSGIAYTAGPYPLAYLGLGDLFVLAFFGPVAICGTAFVQAGEVPPLAWAASIPIGALATAILVVNNARDRETDARANKRTLAVRLGPRAAIAEYALLLIVAYGVVGLLAWDRPWVALVGITAPWAAVLAHRVATRHGAELNAALAGTARLLFVFGLSLAVTIGGS